MIFHNPYLGNMYARQYSRYGYGYHNFPHYSPANSQYENNQYYKNDTYHKNDSYYKNYQYHKNEKNAQENVESNHISSNDDIPIFQLFGINLYFDDILLICIIFFLYKEGVKDESLFIALILLLLS